MANTGIRSIGPALGQLVRMTDNGLERVRTCWDIFNSPPEGSTGLDHLLSSNEFKETVTYAVVYGAILLAIIWIVRAVLRKVTKVLDWLSGYSKNK